MTTELALYAQYPAVMFAIERVREGDTLSEACKQSGITVTAFRRIANSDTSIAELYAEAKTNGDDALADKLLTLHEEESDPRIISIMARNIQWLLERRSKAYSPRIEHNHTHGADKELIAALNRGRDRVMNANAPLLLQSEAVVEDVEYVEVEDLSQFI